MVQFFSIGLLLVILPLGLPAEEGGQGQISEVFPYRLDDLKGVRDALAQVISPEGKTVFLYDKRKVLVQDRIAQFEMIRAVMKEFDPALQEAVSVPGVMVRVELFYQENEAGGANGVNVSGRVKMGPVAVANRSGSGNKIHVNVVERNLVNSSHQTAFLMVQSGSWARIRVAKEVSRPVYFSDYLSRFGYLESGVRFESREVGTVMEVAPVVRGNLIDLTLTPVITSVANGETLDFKIRELSTRLTLASGARLQVGGFQGAREEFNRYFFASESRGQSSQGSFAVRATIQRDGRQ